MPGRKLKLSLGNPMCAYLTISGGGNQNVEGESSRESKAGRLCYLLFGELAEFSTELVQPLSKAAWKAPCTVRSSA
jgi:hypothetical protein